MAVIQGTIGDDSLTGTSDADELYGLDGDDTLEGGDGDDLLDGGTGNDHMEGGAGNDVYYVDGWDVIVEAAGGGVDEVRTGLQAYSLATNVENAFQTTADASWLWGNGLANLLQGGSGVSSIYADGGDDIVLLSAGRDQANGGDGFDTFIIQGASTDYVLERHSSNVFIRAAGAAPGDWAAVLYSFEAIVFAGDSVTIDPSTFFDRYGTAAADTLTGDASDNLIFGYGGDDNLSGGAGNDEIDGGAGADTMAGGTGDDYYILDDAGDSVVEADGEGYDALEFTGAYLDLGATSVEEAWALNETGVTMIGGAGLNLLHGASGADWIEGGGGNDYAVGDAGDDHLEGGAGDDELNGGLGSDVMIGGTGDDIYDVDSSGDTVVEAAGEGTDLVQTTAALYHLGANVENLRGEGGDLQYLYGNDAANLIQGGWGESWIYGLGGDDVVRLSQGYDAVDGGTGSDTFVIAGASTGYEFFRSSGHTLIREVGAESWVYVANLVNVETLVFEGDAVTIDLTTVFDRFGTAGDDTIYGDASENRLYGYAGNDTLIGGDRSDWLDGGTGIDLMIGGFGNDTYYVDDSADVIVEDANGDFDIAQVTAHYFDMGTAYIEQIFFIELGDVTFLGSAGNNMMFGSTGTDWLEGKGGNDYLDGGAGDDHLDGGAGNDELDGWLGNDVMIGGAGNDIYNVDSAGDVVTEAANGGIDMVKVRKSSYTLPANVENADLHYFAAGVSVTGNALANVFYMGAGADSVDGLGGVDTISYEFGGAVTIDLANYLFEGAASDDHANNVESVTGSAYDDVIRGNGASGTIDGGLGADYMAGRAGNDVYYVDNAGDVVVELAGGGATDEVRVRNLQSYTLPNEVERLVNVTNLLFHGTGNDLNNDMTGGTTVDWLYGGEGHDSLNGGAGDDMLFGEGGHDTLNGGSGADQMAGGYGNDIYIVDNIGDTVTEIGGQGTDTVYSGLATYTLTANVENLNYNGSGGFHGVGNTLSNIIYGLGGNDTLEGMGGFDELRGASGDDILLGGAGDDILYGGSGVDLLSGGDGSDTFRFSSYETGTGSQADRITDFTHWYDKVDLTGIDAQFWTPGDQAFTFIGTGAFSGTAGELRYEFDGTDTWLKGDTDGDGLADFEIVFTGDVPLVTSDFLL